MQKKAAVRALYKLDPLKKNIADRAAYRENSDRRKAAAKPRYDANPGLKCELARQLIKPTMKNLRQYFVSIMAHTVVPGY